MYGAFFAKFLHVELTPNGEKRSRHQTTAPPIVLIDHQCPIGADRLLDFLAITGGVLKPLVDGDIVPNARRLDLVLFEPTVLP